MTDLLTQTRAHPRRAGRARIQGTARALTCCGALLLTPLAQAAGNVALGGWIKASGSFTHFSDGPVAQGVIRDIYMPVAVPVVPGSQGRSYFDGQAKDTRLWLNGDTRIQGHTVKAYVEFDFQAFQNNTPSEATTNAYSPALRRAFITMDDWLIGQEWTTFHNLAATPEGVDYIGPVDGMVFVRQVQLRYSHGPWQLALENPQTTVAANGTAAFANTDDNTLPDAVVRYNFNAGGNSFSMAALARQLSARSGGNNDTNAGFGGSFAGKIKVGDKDDVRFTVSGGSGIGRYLGGQLIGDAAIDARGELARSKAVNGFIAYRHVWGGTWRSTVTASAFHARRDAAFGGATSRHVTSGTANLLYTPLEAITLGAEFRYAKRKVMNDESGDFKRLQLMARYDF